jgi:dTDP-4-amino-4,6-dideoxygalactose transaminase
MKIPLGKPYINTNLALEKIKEALDSRWISGGPRINEFEEKVKEYNNDPDGHYVAVSNCTTALEMALLSLNDGNRLKSTDEVIVPSWSWVASGFAVNNAGGTPVWCDINEYGVPYAEDIETRITPNTKAILIVHQMGIPCDLDKINSLSKKYSIPIVEDAACAFGAEYKGKKIGNSKNTVCYSFQARKCLTTGEGGMIVVRDQKQAEFLKSYRAFGTSVSPLERDKAKFLLKEHFDFVGNNFKMADIPCALGLAQLQIFDEEINLRKEAGEYYNYLINSKLSKYGVSPLNITPDYCTKYNWQNFHLLLDEKYNRDQVVDLLRKRNIGCKWDIQAIHLEPAYNQNLDLPQTLKYHNHGLWLAFYAEITKEEQEYVIDTLSEILAEL